MKPAPIKRYPNRKLYNTVTKRYITLDEIGELIRDGVEVAVSDSATGEDITTFILTQVIVGQGRKGDWVLPRGLLFELIRMHHETKEAIVQQLLTLPNLSDLLSTLGFPTQKDVDQLRAFASYIDDNLVQGNNPLPDAGMDILGERIDQVEKMVEAILAAAEGLLPAV